jgi:hypothetical protein
MIKFFRGLKSSYNVTDHGEGLYFATDTKEVLMNGEAYTGPKQEECKHQWIDVVETIEEAFTKGGMVSLSENLDLSQPIEVKPGVSAILDLNGCTLKNVNPETTDTIIVSEGASLTIKGNGEVDGGEGSSCNMAVYIKGGHCVIESGKFHVGKDKNGSWNSCIEINGGVLEIKGGEFSTEVPYNGRYFVLNKKDFSNSVISVTGGRFINYDPSNSETENPA